MRKIYESLAFEKVGHFQSILENEGIQTLLNNEGITQAEGVVPGFDPYPELWVMKDGDYEKAIDILKRYPSNQLIEVLDIQEEK